MNIKEILKNVIHKNTTNEDNATSVGASTAHPSSKARPQTKTILILLPILLLLIATLIAIGITNAAGNTVTPQTDQTFTEDGDGYYIWVRAVDHAGNKGPWSEAQRVWIDNKGPSEPTITGGSSAYALSRTISVSTAADDAGASGIAYYEYYKKSGADKPDVSATGTQVTTSATSQTFNTNIAGDYVFFRAVDVVGNKGAWSAGEQVYIDINVPTITVKQASLTITQGQSYNFSDYFTVAPNGTNTNITTTYKIGSTSCANTSSLAVGTHTVTCTATKTGGNSNTATMIVVVESAGPPLVTTATSIQSKTTEYQDAKGNRIWVPEGFKVRTDYATTVQNGIVIEDTEGSQFVWIPIGTITKDDGTKVIIELGRYDFDDMIYNGAKEATLMQSAKNFKQGSFEEVANATIRVKSYEHYEPDYFEYDSDYFYTTYHSYPSQYLEPWINNTLEMGGYYMARWEARLGSKTSSANWSGRMNAGDEWTDDIWPYERVSFEEPPLTRTSGLNFVYKGELWNNLPQWASIKGSHHRVYESRNGGYYSSFCDLVNSYAWDTALIFIQKCSGDSTYGTVPYVNDNGIDLTGENYIDDVGCNIYNMNSNLFEWTTEYYLGWSTNSSKPNGYEMETYSCLRGVDKASANSVVAGSRRGGLDPNREYYYELGFRSILIVDYEYEDICGDYWWFFDWVDDVYAITR